MQMWGFTCTRPLTHGPTTYPEATRKLGHGVVTTASMGNPHKRPGVRGDNVTIWAVKTPISRVLMAKDEALTKAWNISEAPVTFPA